jgi:hypothetical protein
MSNDSAPTSSFAPASPSADPVVLVMLEGVKEIERLRAALTALLFAAEAGRYPGEGLRMLVKQVTRVALRVDEDAFLDQALDALRCQVEQERLAGAPRAALLGALLPAYEPEQYPEQREQPEPARRHRSLHAPGRKR